MKRSKYLPAAMALSSLALLAGCSGNAAPEVNTPAAVTTTSPSPSTSTPTVEAEAERGSRANPLAVGETRKISTESMWTVGASAPTVVGDGHIVLPLTIGLDWAVADEQARDAGEAGLSETGVDPAYSLDISFVSASGRSYSSLDEYVELEDDLYMLGTVYPPAESVSVNYAVSTPDTEVEGGTWVVRNGQGESVFISAR